MECSYFTSLPFTHTFLDRTKYFVKGFYEDHLKRYKKRPIYWMVASPKKGFMSLIYMHRYQSDIFARVRSSYLTEYIAKLEAHKETLHLTTISETASNADRKSAQNSCGESLAIRCNLSSRCASRSIVRCNTARRSIHHCIGSLAEQRLR